MTQPQTLQTLASQVTLDHVNKALAERSLYEFMKQSWHVVEPGREFKDNWHLRSICEHLELAYRGKIRLLIINIPPRHMKSLLSSVFFPCWVWVQEQHKQFFFASYSSSLSIRDSIKCRHLFKSEWFQARWPHIQLRPDQDQKQKYVNMHNGVRFSTSTTGTITGEGGDIIVIDDPHNVVEIESDAERQKVCYEFWDQALPSRLNDPNTGTKILIMQRIHHEDLTGHVLKTLPEGTLDPEHENYDPEIIHLCVPAEYEEDHEYPFRPHPEAAIQQDPRAPEANEYYDPKSDKNLLWPDRINRKALEDIKRPLGIYGAQGQLQQRPNPKEGGILKTTWWREWESDNPPQFIYVLQSWDTAFSEKETKQSKPAYSACTTWGVFVHGGRYNIMLMNRFRDYLAYPDLRRKAKEKFEADQPDAILIEKKASGQSLIQDLRQANIPVIPYNPDRDKVARAHSVAPIFEDGMVWYMDRNWSHEVIKLCAQFPAGDGADVVDTVTQALIRLRRMWYAIPDNDDTFEVPNRMAPDDPLADFVDMGNVVSLKEGRALYG